MEKSIKLKSYGIAESNSRGRKYVQEQHRYRRDFERDRDRVIHSEAFRRLEGKTQVFMVGVNDHYRNRLTHSIEVSQIGRTIARVLGLNEVLTEAICLAHDLGHSPFGHAGEHALNGIMTGFGGFEHNRQSLRIVEEIERPYPGFAGLNLMYETRLGLAKHKSKYDDPGESSFLEKNCSIEGQISDLSDRIAYNCHDLEDGLRSRLITEDDLCGLGLWDESGIKIGAGSMDDGFVRRTRTAKGIIEILVSDLIEASGAKIESAGIESVDEIYGREDNLVELSRGAEKGLCELEDFLMERFYLHEEIQATSKKVDGWLGELFGRFVDEPGGMPGYYQGLAVEYGVERAVCDYVSGMTDRFCLKLLGEI